MRFLAIGLLLATTAHAGPPEFADTQITALAGDWTGGVNNCYEAGMHAFVGGKGQEHALGGAPLAIAVHDDTIIVTLRGRFERSIDDTVYAVGVRGTIVKSIDAGKTWIVEKSGTTKSLRAVVATDSEVFAIGDDGTLVTRGAKKWTRGHLDKAAMKKVALAQIVAATADHIYARGWRGLLRSDDRGRSWEYVLTLSRHPCY